MKIKNFIDEIYNVKFIIFIGNEKERNNYIEKTFKIKGDNLFFEARSYFIENEKGGTNFLYFKQLNLTNRKTLLSNLYNLQHEIIHSVFEVLNYVDVKFNTENHEHFNYYYGYIFKKIYTLLTKD